MLVLSRAAEGEGGTKVSASLLPTNPNPARSQVLSAPPVTVTRVLRHEVSVPQ